MAGSWYPPHCVLLLALSSFLLFHFSSAFLSFPTDQQALQSEGIFSESADSAPLRDSALQGKRRSSFRSDLGKRDVIVDNQSEQFSEARDLDLDDKGQREMDGMVDKRVNRFRSDLGKRRYRVDLGKRSDPMVDQLDQGVAMDDVTGLGNHGDVLFDLGVHGDDEKRAKFRSDLGKRTSGGTRPQWWTGKRVFRSDLGKRRYRSDLG